MPAQDFAGRTVADHVEAFTSGKVAARDIVEGLLERTKQGRALQPDRDARYADGARAAADALDARRKARHGSFGALAAVPVSAKDLILTKGLRTAFASDHDEGQRAVA